MSYMPLKNQLVVYLKKHSQEWHPSGTLQRMVWQGRRGNSAPRTVVRRLEELENESMVAVGYNGMNAEYRYIHPDLRPKYKRTRDRAHMYSNDRWKE